MMQSRLLRPSLVLSAFVFVLAASCRESSDEPQRVARPMTGTYDFTTVLDTFILMVPIGGPGCAGYCTTVSADSNGKLAGTFTLGDSVGKSPGYGSRMAYLEIGATITGTFRGSSIQEAYTRGYFGAPVPMTDVVDGSTIDAQLMNQNTDLVAL